MAALALKLPVLQPGIVKGGEGGERQGVLNSKGWKLLLVPFNRHAALSSFKNWLDDERDQEKVAT